MSKDKQFGEFLHNLEEEEEEEEKKVKQDLDKMLAELARTAPSNFGYTTSPYMPMTPPEPIKKVTLESLNEKIENVYNLLKLIGSAVLKEGLKDENKR